MRNETLNNIEIDRLILMVEPDLKGPYVGQLGLVISKDEFDNSVVVEMLDDGAWLIMENWMQVMVVE